MKCWESVYVFHHPWEQVTQAAWRKYPNPMNPSVTAMDVVDRNVQSGVLTTERIIGCHWGIPRWIANIVGSPNVMYANEKSEINPGKKSMVLKTQNITLCKYIAVDETLVYSRHPHDPEKTILVQEAVITVQGVPLSSYVEDLMASSISVNAAKGHLAMEWVLKKINDEFQDFANSMRSSLHAPRPQPHTS